VRVLRWSIIVPGQDRQSAVDRYQRLFGSHPINEFHIPERDLLVTAFAGFSVLTCTREALAPVRNPRATLFVDSLKEMEERLVKTGWKLEGTLGSDRSLLARDSDGNMFEFVEEPEGDPSRP
jgi:hypothetical protein